MFYHILLDGIQYVLQLEEEIAEDGVSYYDLRFFEKKTGVCKKNGFLEDVKKKYRIVDFAVNEAYQLTGELLAEQMGNLYFLAFEIVKDKIFLKEKRYVCVMPKNWRFREHQIYSLKNGLKIISDFENGKHIYYTIKADKVLKNILEVQLTILTTIYKEKQELQIIKTNEGIDANDKSFYWDHSKEDLLHLKDDTIYVGVLEEDLDLKKLKKIIQIPSPNAIEYQYEQRTNEKLVFHIYERDFSVENEVVRYIQRMEYDYINDIILYGEKKVEL